MRHSIPESYRKRLASGWGDDVFAQIERDDGAGVPSTWSALAAQCDQTTLAACLAPLASVLPRFVSYVQTRAEGAAVVRDDDNNVPILAIAFPDWTYHAGEFGPGFLVAGPPAKYDDVAALEERIGPLPRSLYELWSVLGCLRAKDYSTICGPLGGVIGHPVSQFEGVFEFEGVGDDLELCSIAEINLDQVNCVVRRRGERVWQDRVVRFSRYTRTLYPCSYSTIEELVTDWEWERWDPAIFRGGG